jgi:hypothetical protein
MRKRETGTELIIVPPKSFPSNAGLLITVVIICRSGSARHLSENLDLDTRGSKKKTKKRRIVQKKCEIVFDF